MKTLSTILFLIASAFCYSQNSKPEIIKKEIPIRNGIDIIGIQSTNQKHDPLKDKTHRPDNKTLVYYNNKFYSADTLQKIKNNDQYIFEIIKIPQNITKDINAIIYIRDKE